MPKGRNHFENLHTCAYLKQRHDNWEGPQEPAFVTSLPRHFNVGHDLTFI